MRSVGGRYRRGNIPTGFCPAAQGREATLGTRGDTTVQPQRLRLEIVAFRRRGLETVHCKAVAFNAARATNMVPWRPNRVASPLSTGNRLVFPHRSNIGMSIASHRL